LVEKKFVIVAVEDEDYRPVIDRVAARGTDPRSPMLGQKGLEVGNLLLELVRRRPG